MTSASLSLTRPFPALDTATIGQKASGPPTTAAHRRPKIAEMTAIFEEGSDATWANGAADWPGYEHELMKNVAKRRTNVAFPDVNAPDEETQKTHKNA